MTIREHLLFALRIGLLTGLIHGTVDIISRIVSLGFEWFELYYPLLLSGSIFTVSFLLVWAGIELLQGISRRRCSCEWLTYFYYLTSAAVLVGIFGIVALNFFLPGSIAGNGQRMNIPGTLAFAAALAILYLLALSVGTRWLKLMGDWAARRGLQHLEGNFLFFCLIFAFFGLAMDLFLIIRGPNSTPARTKAATNSPNIILITLDTVRADHLSAYGYEKDTTPFLKEFAKNSVLFENATSASSWTLPSHASIFTGQYPFRHKATKRHMLLDHKATTLAEVLSEHGFRTAGFVGGAFCKAKYGVAQGFGYYSDRLDFFEYAPGYKKFDIRLMFRAARFFSGRWIPSINRIFGADAERPAEDLNREALKWLEKNKQDPFFLFINYFDAHEPYIPKDEYRVLFTDEYRPYREVQEAFAIGERAKALPEGLVQYMTDLYDAEIRQLDDQLRKFFLELEKMGLLDSTLVIVTSDHGEEFYEHGGFEHERTLYEEVIHVPLLLSWPKRIEARRLSKRIDNLDIFATVLELLDLNDRPESDSESLKPLFTGEGHHTKNYAYSELSGRIDTPGLNETGQQSISDSDWKMIEVVPDSKDLPTSLFNLKGDRSENSNLYNSYPDVREMLRREIIKKADPTMGRRFTMRCVCCSP